MNVTSTEPQIQIPSNATKAEFFAIIKASRETERAHVEEKPEDVEPSDFARKLRTAIVTGVVSPAPAPSTSDHRRPSLAERERAVEADPTLGLEAELMAAKEGIGFLDAVRKIEHTRTLEARLEAAKVRS